MSTHRNKPCKFKACSLTFSHNPSVFHRSQRWGPFPGVPRCITIYTSKYKAPFWTYHPAPLLFLHSWHSGSKPTARSEVRGTAVADWTITRDLRSAALKSARVAPGLHWAYLHSGNLLLYVCKSLWNLRISKSIYSVNTKNVFYLKCTICSTFAFPLFFSSYYWKDSLCSTSPVNDEW